MLDLINTAKEIGLKEGKGFYYEEDIEKRFVGYVSWRVEFMTAKKINSIDAAKPFFYMMQRSMPYANFESFFVDVYNQRDKFRRPEWDKLVEKCKDGQIDVIVIPSIQTLSSCISEIIEIARKLKALPKPVYIYFMVERLNSEDSAFEMACSFLATLQQEQDEINKKKRKLSAYIKEGISNIALMKKQGKDEKKIMRAHSKYGNEGFN